MDLVSIQEIKQQAGPVFQAFRFRAQLERSVTRTTKTGNPYYETSFADAEGSLLLRVWNNTPMFATCAQLRAGQFYEVTGEFGLGGDGRSVDGREWTVRALDDAETAGVLAGSAVLRMKQDQDYAFLTQTAAAISDPRLRALCLAFFDQFGKRMRRTAAARSYHHARRGGLVEHVAQMTRTAIQICIAYPLLNRDLLVAGVLFHDVGKLWENAYQENGFEMPYSELSELLGHITLGTEIVNRLWRSLADDPAHVAWADLDPPSDRVRLHLLHLIVSHHGELQFGSPVVPKTPEAQALHYIDNLDAKMEMFDHGYQVAPELGRNVYDRVRPLTGNLVAPLPKFAVETFAPSASSIVAETDGAEFIPEEPMLEELGDPQAGDVEPQGNADPF